MRGGFEHLIDGARRSSTKGRILQNMYDVVECNEISTRVTIVREWLSSCSIVCVLYEGKKLDPVFQNSKFLNNI